MLFYQKKIYEQVNIETKNCNSAIMRNWNILLLNFIKLKEWTQTAGMNSGILEKCMWL